jgi:hypothetical protein
MKSPGISETKRCIIRLNIGFKGDVVQIAAKLPQEVEHITGVYFSIKTIAFHTGTISLRFSEGVSNSLLNQRVSNRHNRRRKIKYMPLCEPVTDNCTLQGYYRDTSTADSSYTLLIYLEYIPRKRENLPSHERAICS